MTERATPSVHAPVMEELVDLPNNKIIAPSLLSQAWQDNSYNDLMNTFGFHFALDFLNIVLTFEEVDYIVHNWHNLDNDITENQFYEIITTIFNF